MGEVRRYDVPPTPPPDEGYWEALLEEAELAMGGLSQQGTNGELTDEAYLSPYSSAGTRPGVSAADWEQVEQVFRTDTTVELAVIGHNRGGLLVEWGGLHGFVPASQLLDFPLEQETPTTRRTTLTEYIGKTLRLRIIELDRPQSRLILSERAAAVPPGTRDGILNGVKAGERCDGIVTNLCHFGVFVDLGGIEGLIHISELSWGRVRHPADMLKRGEKIQVFILEVNPEEGRIALSLKRLQPDPWKTVEQRYTVGQKIEGTVTHVVDFGAFVCVEAGLEGLIHISELAEGHFLHPYNVVREGDKVEARIVHIDGVGRRLGLSLRR